MRALSSSVDACPWMLHISDSQNAILELVGLWLEFGACLNQQIVLL